MPDIDPAQIVAAAQEEAKNAQENYRSYLLAENERLRNDTAELSDLRVRYGKQEIKIQFYRDTKGCRDVATVVLTILGLTSLCFPTGLPGILRGIYLGLICAAATSYLLGWWLSRIDTNGT